MAKYALISVSDKTGIVELARKLKDDFNYQIISTGGTRKILAQAGIDTVDIAEFTGVPEMLGGRVKTLNNMVYGGILARRDASQADDIAKYNIALIDVVVVNLYPFESTILKPDITLDDAIEEIDIGGVSLLRASAKNYKYVWSISNPSQYDRLVLGLNMELDDLTEGALEMRKDFAINSYRLTSSYDNAISNYLEKDYSSINSDSNTSDDILPNILSLKYRKVETEIRYGENPHQRAALYMADSNSNTSSKFKLGGIINARKYQGKDLSYNNIADADAALKCAGFISKQFPSECVCVIVKHANPCGIALGSTYLEAYEKAYSCDPTSAFGGIIAFAYGWNTPIDSIVSQKILANQFVEVIISEEFTSDALDVFKQKQNIRVLSAKYIAPEMDMKAVSGGGILYQESDIKTINESNLIVKSTRVPTEEEISEMLFAWSVAKYVKSNAIIFTRNKMTVGIGAGQMSRIDSTRIAIMKAKNANLSLEGCVVASDAFFPFRDGVDAILETGASCIIQPGGSMRDSEVIQAVNEKDGILVFTGIRHFLH